MNNYIVDLVKQDLKNYPDYGIVRDSRDQDSFLIYSSNKMDPYLIRFKNYWFEACTNENGNLICHIAFSDLKSLIEFIEKNNK